MLRQISALNVTLRPHIRFGSLVPRNAVIAQAEIRQSLSFSFVSFSVFLPTNEKSCFAVSPLSLISFQFIYRLSACSELCLGLFSTSDLDAPASSEPTYETARPTSSASPTKKAVLIAHLVATKCDAKTFTASSMECPPNWQSSPSPVDTLGHQEQGRTIAVHSVAVLPKFQGRHLGRTTLKSYVQRMETAGIADRISLLAHQQLFNFYEGLGFVSKGPSKCNSYGGGWYDLVRLPVMRPKRNRTRLC